MLLVLDDRKPLYQQVPSALRRRMRPGRRDAGAGGGAPKGSA